MALYGYPYLNENENAQADAIADDQFKQLEDEYLHTRLMEMLQNTNIIDPKIAEQQQLKEIAQLKQANANLNQNNTENLYALAQERIDALIKSGEFDGNRLLSLIEQDPVLSQVYPTDSGKLGLINQIQEAQKQEADPANALQGKYIKPEDEGFLDSALSSLKSGLKNTAASLWYDPQRLKTLNEFNHLPSDRLTQIKKKLDLQDELKSKLYETSQNLTSLNPAEKAKALQQYNLYKKQLEGMGLNQEEEALWANYGERFTNLIGKKDLLRAERNDFTGANQMSLGEAQKAMEDYARDRYFDRYKGGASYTNLEYAKEALLSKFSGSTLGSDLGAIAASALPFMLGGIPGIIGKGISLGSDAISRFTDTLEHYFDKYGNIPSDKEIKALAGALGSTIIDFYGSSMFVKGLSRAGFVKSIEDRLKDSLYSVNAVKGLSSKSMAAAVAGKLQLNHLRPDAEDLTKSLHSAAKNVEESLKGTPLTLREKITKSSKKALATANRAAHQYANVGLQDIAIAGTKLAGENVGASLIDQWAKNEYNFNDIVDSAVSGFVGGGMFHTGAAPAHVALYALKDKYAKYRQGKFSRLDSEKEWQKSLNLINDKKNAEYKNETIEEFSNRYTSLKKDITKEYNDEVNKVQKQYGEAITQNKEGNWVFDSAKAPSGLSNKQLKQAQKEVNNLNDLNATVKEASATIDARLKTLSDMEQSNIEANFEEATKVGSTMSEEAKEKAKVEYYEKIKDVEKKKKALSKDLQISEEQAQHIIDKKSDVITDDDSGKEFKNTISEFGETNAYIYEDLFGKKDATDALKNKDYNAFEKALDAEVTAGTMTKERKDKLLETFTPEVFEETSRTDNGVDELGMKENTEAKAKYVAPFSEYNKATQKDTKKALGLNETKPKTNILDEAKSIDAYTPVTDFTKMKEQDPIANAIAEKLLDDKDISTASVDVKNQVEAKVDASSLSDADKRVLKENILKDIDAIATKAKEALKEANKVNKELSGKKLYKTQEAAEKELSKYTKEHSVNSFYVKEVGGKYILADAMSEIPEEKVKELKDIAAKDTSTVEDINKWFEENKEYYNKVTYKGKPLSEFIKKEFLDKVLELNKTKDVDKKKLKDEAYKSLLNINASITSSLTSTIKSEAEGISHSYTNAEWVREFKERTRKAEEAAQDRNKTDNKTQAIPPEDIEDDTIEALRDLFNEFGFTVDSAIDENTLVDALRKMHLKGYGITYGDLVLLDSYRKRITAEKKYKNRENALKYLACITAIFDLAKKNNLVNMDDKSNHALISFGKKGHTWDKASERKQVVNTILHFYKEGTDALNDAEAFTNITIPDGIMSSTANTTMEDESYRRKINAYKSFYRKLFKNVRVKHTHERIAKILNVLSNYTETSRGTARVTALDLIRNELGTLTAEEERILANPTGLKASSKVLADLFVKIMQTNTFKRYFGLVPTTKDSSGKLSQIKDNPIILVNILDSNTEAFATFNEDDVATINTTNSAYNNLVALDKYLGMEGDLYETFWSLYPGESEELELIRNKNRYEVAITEHNSGFNASHTYRHFRNKVINKILSKLDLTTLDYGRLYNNLNKAIRSGKYEEILQGVVEPDLLKEYQQIFTDSKLKLNFFDQNAYMATLAQAIASQRLSQIQNFKEDYEAYKQANQVFQLAEVLKHINPEGYTTHEEIPINNVDGSQLGSLTAILRHAFHEVTETTVDGGTVSTTPNYTLQDLIRFNNTVADKEYHLDDAATTLGSIFTTEGDYRDIPDFEGKPLTEGNDKVAKFLAAFINAHSNINNTYTGKKSTGHKQAIRSSGRNTHIENDIMSSPYAKDFYIGDPENASPLASDNFIRDVLSLNPEYADIAGLQQIVNRIKTLVKVASKFSHTAGNLADEIFFQKFGREAGTYNREVVTTMAGTALGMLTRMASGQSENWVDKQVSTGMFSERAGRAFLASNFISKNNLGEDLGLQILSALNIKSDSPDASYNAKIMLAAALAGRALNMLADNSIGGKEGLIAVKYFDCDTGDVYTEQPSSGRVISVVEITETGRKWSDEIIQLNEARGTENGNRHLLSDLLNLNLDGRNYKQAKEYKADQEKLAKRFNEGHAQQIKPSLFEKPANGIEPEILYDEKHDIVRVVLDNDTNHTVYLNRHEILKKDGTMLSYSRLQENAYQKDTSYTIHQDEVLDEFSYLKDSSGNWFNTLAEFEQAYEGEPEKLAEYKAHLGLTEPSANGYFDRADKTKNEVQFKQIIDFCKELSQLKPGKDGTVDLYFPVINTVNNRVYVDSLGINPRELKFLRHYFTPKATVYDGSGNPKAVGDNVIPTGRDENQKAILFALVCANFGLDTDKAPMKSLLKAGMDITQALARAAEDLNITVSRTTSVLDCMAIIDKANEFLEEDEITYATTKKPGGAKVELEKSGEAVLAVKEILRQVYDADTSIDVPVANLMLEDKAIDDFRLRLEIDGLTNGIGFHLSTSAWFGNNDAYSYGLLAGVGIFPKNFMDTDIRDFVSAKMKEGALDSYEHLGVDAREAALTNFVNNVVEGGRDAIKANTGLLKILQAIYGIESSDYADIFNQILDRNTMKYVLMPASYGAGRDALVKYVLTQISRKISERVYKMYSSKTPDYAAIHHLYSQLAALNGGKLTLVDGDNNELVYKGQELSELQIKSYSVLLPVNNSLNAIFSDAIAEPIVSAADNLMSAAEEHTEALTKSASAISSVFNEMLATVLTSPEWKDVDLSKLTRAQVDNITKRIQTAIHIGSDASSLNLLKDAVENSIEVLKLRIPSLLKKGKGIVLSAKNTLTRESIASALAPEVNHTKDSDAINRCQAAVRESLGAFMGIHDAVIATFNQIDGHIGEKFNKEFFESNLYAYRTLLEIQNILNQCKSWVELNRDKSSVYTESEIMASIDDALSSVLTVASNQIGSRFKFLNRIINSNESGTINQYAMADITSYEVTPAMAKDYLDNIQQDLAKNNMVTTNDGSFKEFELFVKQQSNGTEFWRQIASLINSVNVFNLDQLRDYLNDPKNGLGEVKDKILEYLDRYNEYRKGAYEASFIETMQEAMQDRSRKDSASDIAIQDLKNNASASDISEPRYRAKQVISELLGLSTVAEELGLVSNSAALDRFFLNRMLRLNNRISHAYGDRSVLNNLVALTSKTHINVWELDQLNQLLRDAKIETNKEFTHVDPFDKTKKSFVIDVTDINLGDLLTEFRRQSLYGISEVSALHNFLTPYIDQITKAVKQRGFEQIVFKMNTVMDRILFSALNREILNATKGSTWDGVTLSIVPAITDKASGSVDAATSIDHQLIELVGEDNIGFYTILANNSNKDLRNTNYKYRNKFTNAYITGDYITRANEEVPVIYKEGDPKGVTTHKVRDLGAKGNSYIGIANTLGFIDTATYSNARTVIPTQYHLSTGDYSSNIVNDDGRVRTYDRYTDEEIDPLVNTSLLNTVAPDEDDNNIVRANTGWESKIQEGSRINIGISSDGKITSASVYNTVMAIPALKAAYIKAQSIYRERQRRFDNGVYRHRDSILIPIDVNDVFIDGVRIHTRFHIVRDDMISLAELKPVVVNTAKALNADRVTLTIDPSADKSILNKFSATSDELAQLYITNPAVRKFFNSIKSNNATNPERVFLRIPDVILNKQNYVMDSLAEDEPSRLAKLNVVAITQDSRPDIFLSTETNRGRIYNHEESVTVDFASLPATRDNNRGVVEKITDMFASLKKQKKENIRHYTDNVKSEEEMTDKEYALYRDIHCDDIDNISNDLNAIDENQGVDNSHLFPVLSKIKSANMLIRYRLNEELGRQGSSVMRRVNGVRVGYVAHGISRSGSGSNLEVFTHELVHIPLEFLNLDPSANKTAIQLYNYVAKNISLSHFDTKDAEDRRIFNYLFRNNTPDAHIEFLVYALTNSRFKNTLKNLMKDKNLSKEFDSKLNSAFSRLLSKFDGDFKDKDILEVVDTIFARSVDLAKHYYNKNPVIPPEAYQAQTSALEPINKFITDKIHTFLTKVFPNRGAAPLFTMLTNAFNPEREKDERFKQIQATELVPQLANLLNDIGDGKNQLANELAQSFRAVSGDNWEYAKLRMASKEIVDKAREQGASAVNAVVRELSKDFSTQAMNNLPEYLLHADVQCLFTTRDSEEVLELIKNKEARYNEIKRIEKVLSKKSNGNFFINASRGLANKLIYGVNTSGIGYNNAYEIANMCGTQAETKDSNLVYPIDDLVTLYTMHELDKRNPKVYAELANNFASVEALTTLHNGILNLEKQHVYGDTNQKYHIPKGELHGGKSTNRYEIIPESQLKAYNWAGYMKVKNAKLDPLYKKLTNENYVLVEGKFLPDVPYVDAATVLTDIFNGRNKQKGYIGGKLIEEAGFQEFYKDEHNNTVVNYLNAQVKRLNKPDFVQIDPNSIDGMFTPSFGIGRSITGTDFVLNEKETNKRLGREYKLTSALGDHFGSVIERNRAPVWNTKVAEALDNIYQERAKDSKITWLTENETDPEREELYKLLPYEIKQYFAEKYPNKGVPIQEANITGVLGYRQLSALKVDKQYYDKLQHSTEEYIDHLLHSAPVAYAETLARYLTRIGKENVVIKGIAVSLGNITSNCVTLGIQGLPIDKVCSYQVEGLNWLKQYNSIKRELELLKVKNVLGEFTKADNARAKSLHDALQSNPLATLAQYGAIPTIAEDLSEQDRLSKDIIYKYVPQEFQDIAHNLVGDQQSYIYSTLQDLATFGDITAKYALYKHLTENKGISKEEAVRQAVTSFIDYSNPLPKELQYLDSIGALPFTKFLLGNQTNVVNTLMKNPAGAMSWIMANSWMNVSDIYGSILGLDAFTNRWHIPGFGLWYDSLASLPIVRATNAAMDIL